MGEQTWLTYAEAARRARSSPGTIRRWRRDGMPMQWRVDDSGQRFRVVELEVLLATWRDKMQASPVHFYRMRKAALNAGVTVPEVPDRFKRRPRIENPIRDASEDESGVDAGATLADVIAELPDFIGQAEHAALLQAMEHSPSL